MVGVIRSQGSSCHKSQWKGEMKRCLVVDSADDRPRKMTEKCFIDKALMSHWRPPVLAVSMEL